MWSSPKISLLLEASSASKDFFTLIETYDAANGGAPYGSPGSRGPRG